ncbi:MAG: M23 family metallopeptidase, partial [Candidatus Firestonebacteria bacterium]|nr:M23 family metallopeptidase [Candidatus Firestonebacteria bacterium]
IFKSDEENILEEITGSFINQNLNFIKNKIDSVSFLGIPLKTDEGSYTLKLKIKYKNREIYDFSKIFKINKKEILIENFTVPEKKVNPITNDVLKIENETINNIILNREIQNILWDKYFIKPSNARISSPFGALRNINNGKMKFYHNGVDIAENFGIEVKAGNSGIVRLTQDFIARGKTIIIDHGCGIFSMYNHLNSINVNVGQKIQCGEIIGYVGNTGLSSGTHLHWELTINGVSVDPIIWTTDKFNNEVISNILN